MTQKQKQMELQKMLDPENKSFKQMRLIQDALLIYKLHGGRKQQIEKEKDDLIYFIEEVLK